MKVLLLGEKLEPGDGVRLFHEHLCVQSLKKVFGPPRLYHAAKLKAGSLVHRVKELFAFRKRIQTLVFRQQYD